MFKKFFQGSYEQAKRASAYKQGMFGSKQLIFDYLLIEEGKSIEEADRLSTVIAQARGVPDRLAPPPKGMDKIKGIFGEIKTLYTEHPEISELILGVLTGGVTTLSGVVVGKNSKDNSGPAPVEPEKIEIDNSEIINIE